MKFGIREIANVVFRAKQATKIGSATFKKGQPVLFIDSAKTSTLESAATSVYAQGGRGNTRLVTWEGEKTLTFTVEDALLSPISFAMLSGAGVVKGLSKDDETNKVHVHMTSTTTVGENGKIDLSDILGLDSICETAPIFVMEVEKDDGSLTGVTYTATVDAAIEKEKVQVQQKLTITDASSTGGEKVPEMGTPVMVDYYVLKGASKVTELQIDAESFAGYYYVEADTLFRAQKDGDDYPANITLPNVKIQSNWTFSMASTGDPSTFTFTMDAMPGYTYFDQKKKVLCVVQIIDDSNDLSVELASVMGHETGEKPNVNDSVAEVSEDNVP